MREEVSGGAFCTNQKKTLAKGVCFPQYQKATGKKVQDMNNTTSKRENYRILERGGEGQNFICGLLPQCSRARPQAQRPQDHHHCACVCVPLSGYVVTWTHMTTRARSVSYACPWWADVAVVSVATSALDHHSLIASPASRLVRADDEGMPCLYVALGPWTRYHDTHSHLSFPLHMHTGARTSKDAQILQGKSCNATW